jgi:ribose-phosphate pyrophosphokinase
MKARPDAVPVDLRQTRRAPRRYPAAMQLQALRILAGDAHPALALRLANAAGIEPTPCALGAFADGETRVRIEGDVRGCDVYVVQPTAPPVNERLMSLALIGDAARAAGAARLTAVLPYFGYARQDARKRPGEPRSAQMAARILECAGFERLLALELHSAALESAFRIPLTHLDADAAALPLLLKWRLPQLTVVSPDAGGLKRAQRYAGALRAGLAVVAKTRPHADAAASLAVLGDVRGRQCLIVDDMASTGGTIESAARALQAAGAGGVHAFFVHAVMSAGVLARIKAAGVRLLAASDSVAADPHEELKIVETAPLLARALLDLAVS